MGIENTTIDFAEEISQYSEDECYSALEEREEEISELKHLILISDRVSRITYNNRLLDLREEQRIINKQIKILQRKCQKKEKLS